MKLLLSLSVSFMLMALSEAHTFHVKKKHHSQPLRPRDLQQTPSDSQLLIDQEAPNSFDLDSVHDLIYMADIMVGGANYSVQLDTGSSDLFIKGDSFPIPGSSPTVFMLISDANHSKFPKYAIGWASGNVSFAPVEFVGIAVPSQAFIDANNVRNPALEYGAQGIAGLGFTKLSAVDLTLNRTSQGSGRSLLYNLFAANPSEPNFIAFALQRSKQPDDDVEGSFSIGEFDPKYSAVVGSARIPTWPVHDPNRWNVLVDALIVNDTITVPTTNVVGAPSNKAVALMDSGASYTYAPKEICDAIYASVPGAVYNATVGYWLVPCGVEINMALQIGGQVFPIHPLDVVPSAALDPSVCLGSFVPSGQISKDFDWLVGDNFLRSAYSVYDFGDFDDNGQMGDPYMKLLSIVDPDDASKDFHELRGGTPRTNITFVGLDGAAVEPIFFISNDISESLERIGKFIPIMLGVVALNALVVIICCIIWLVSFCRKRRLRALARTPTVSARTPRSRMSPMPMDPRNSYVAGSPQPHVYEPVSMALTEDTFIPPTPAFLAREGSKLNPGDRPKSIA
ncbi:hypothetical protein CVT24_004032 [Panaeolus cyanescens]|uniref:Peptidase A1 domain-containing protein n=1 Tax=Panaeolus cyanescens TaxID=181874 RepID=A0A409Y6H4_9AGAR|nr:hypothetical protein CVT24_004032 [Panaeolus cyanescens]